jgi:hypothetical protein
VTEKEKCSGTTRRQQQRTSVVRHAIQRVPSPFIKQEATLRNPTNIPLPRHNLDFLHQFITNHRNIVEDMVVSSIPNNPNKSIPYKTQPHLLSFVLCTIHEDS